MIRLILAHLRHRAGRSLALLAGVLVATTGFTVLTGSVATAQLQVKGEVNAEFRGAYDILVRPKGARSAIESERDLVQPNYLSGIYGGITTAQWHEIEQVAGVEVAAPIASLGYTATLRFVTPDLTDLVDRSADRQLLRLDPTWYADRDLTAVTDEPQYVYVTKHPLVVSPAGTCGPDSIAEVLPDGGRRPLCGLGVARSALRAYQLLPNGSFLDGSLLGIADLAERTAPRLVIGLPWWSVMGTAAVDPAQEARLVGLDHAVVQGRYLTATDTIGEHHGIPVLYAEQPAVEESLSVGIARMPGSAAAAVPGADPLRLHDTLSAAKALHVRTTDFPTSKPVLDVTRPHGIAFLNNLMQGGLPQYTVDPDGALRAVVQHPDSTGWASTINTAGADAPAFLTDTPFRVMRTQEKDGPILAAEWVGVLDPAKISGFSANSRVPLETYQAAQATGADQATRDRLGGQPLRPASNPQGYFVAPPLLLMPLQALPSLLGPAKADAAISAVRVRVSDVNTLDPTTRERIRSIAETIATRTGLDVDITVGSSLAPQTVVLPAGRFGRPELRLSELWSKKGVAVAIITAVDRKSALLFGLILVVCVLFLGNAAVAAVRDRRRELAVLACLGWPGRRLAGLIAGEVAVVALAGGIGAALLTWPLGRLAGITVSWRHALLALPVALLLAMVAAIEPALQAARAHPAAALAPRVARVRRRRLVRARSVAGLALSNARRRPARTALGVAAVAFGVGAFTPVATLVWVFHGQVTGTLLGDAVSVTVRPVDTLAVAATLVLAAFALADVLYLNVRERAAELATLRATGWTAAAVTRLIAYEGMLIGVLGALLGAGLGLGLVRAFVGGVSAYAWGAAGAAAAIGCVLAALAVLLPARVVHRLPLAGLLAAE
ncbi:FtsX-like permease family protein [Hamadaea tsunoensis]|uniref:FtsX-like permease family protein n=1 Tax=Hamadaea tsunoensis TaxID=53368 RepID=UPI000429E314|nr:FtsX-like permease family protein [Hamadaea tsunoensis]